MFVKNLGLTRRQQSPNASQGPIDLVQMLKHHYNVLLLPFEPIWTKAVQKKVFMTARQTHQQQQMAAQQAMVNAGGEFTNQQQMFHPGPQMLQPQQPQGGHQQQLPPSRLHHCSNNSRCKHLVRLLACLILTHLLSNRHLNNNRRLPLSSSSPSWNI